LPSDAAIGLAALVVTYQRLGPLQRTVARLRAEPVDRICIVDNGSTDGTREWLSSLDEPRLRLIHAPRNLGGAGGFETGLRLLTEQDDPDWVLLMDDDARPRPGAVAAFRAGRPWSWDVVSAAVYGPCGGIAEINRPTVNPFWDGATFWRTLRRVALGRARAGFHLPDAAYAGPPREIDATSFVGLFLSRRAIAQGGFPDGRLFLYGDDVLYTLGLRQAGLRIGFVPDIRFEHDGGRAGQRRYAPVWKAYYGTRNGIHMYRAAAGPLFLPAMAVVLAQWLLAGRHYGAERRAYYRLLWRGLRDGAAGRLARPHAEVLRLARPR
jgi:GT2 family glycosyltransferase